eukprot:m.124788 g.124788  ORF g.124788 m.124788 type:complete len:127 (+) comp37854_c0_seq10:12712-13092(+)
MQLAGQNAAALLALYREVGSKNKRIDRKVLDALEKYCSNSSLFPPWAKTLARQAIRNRLGGDLGPRQLRIVPGQSHQTRVLVAIAFHAGCAIQAAQNNTLGRAIHLLFQQPDRFYVSRHFESGTFN